MFVGFQVGRVLGNLVLGFCIRVGTPLKCLILFYLFFANKKNKNKMNFLELVGLSSTFVSLLGIGYKSQMIVLLILA